MQTILPRTDPLQIDQAIKSAAAYLAQHDLCYGHGTQSAVDDAAWLVLECAGLSPIHSPNYSQVLSRAAVECCDVLLRRRAEERIPVAYLVGRTWFAGYEFYTDRRALIPRSPLAELIQNEFRGILSINASFNVLDLCTGGGCIALATAKTIPHAHVIGSDISIDALNLAQKNCELHQLGDRVGFINSDLFSDITGRFDLIISNPPYVDADDMQAIAPEFRHEPRLGLESGNDGLTLTRQIINQAVDYLSPEGVLIVEVGNSADTLQAQFPHLPFIWLDFAQGGDGVFVLNRSDLP